MNPLLGRVRTAFDSDQGRELMDGLTPHEKSMLMNNLLDFDFYEAEQREAFYKSLDKDDRKIYRKMMHAGIDVNFIQFFLTGNKRHKIRDFIKKFFDRKDIVRLMKDGEPVEFELSRSRPRVSIRRSNSFDEIEFKKSKCNIQ